MGSWGVLKSSFFLKMWLENEKKYQEECAKNYFSRIFKKSLKKLWKTDVAALASNGIGFCKSRVIGVDNPSVCLQIILQVPALSLVHTAYNEHLLLKGGPHRIIGHRGGTDDQGPKQSGRNVSLASP